MTIDLKDRLYTSSEVADILGVSLRSVYRYLEEGKLDADIKTATGRHRFSKKNILDFLRPSDNQVSNNQSKDSVYFENDDVLDLPALSKTTIDKNEDDFDFDFDEEFLKNLEKNSEVTSPNVLEDSNGYSNVKGGEYQDDDLEKLLKEFEEQEAQKDNSEEDISSTTANNEKLDSYNEVSQDDELEKLLKSLESSLGDDFQDNKDVKDSSHLNQSSASESKSSVFDDFDFDLDFDFNTDSNKTENQVSQPPVESASEVVSEDTEDSESEDNWLERFRKAAEKNSTKKEVPTTAKEDSTFSTMFENTNLDVFFEKPVSQEEPVSSITNLSDISNNSTNVETLHDNSDDRYEYFYTSSLGGLKEIAQTADSIAKKFDIDYAFTLNAGLSLHKPIAPFSVIHLYVREKDLELFEDYLKLSPSSEESASVCLITQDSNEVFRDCYELHGLNVVSNVQLRSDLIDKGLDKLAREI